MRSSLIRLFFSCIIIVFSFECQSKQIDEIVREYQAGQMSDLKLVRSMGSHMRRHVRDTDKQYEKQKRESNLLTCKECQQVAELALITSKALMQTEEVRQHETLGNEVQFLKAISLYRHHIDTRFDETCEKRNFMDDVEIVPREEDKDTIVFNGKINFFDIDALGIKRAYRGLTFYFGRPPFINGEPQTIVKVHLPQSGDGEVTIYKRPLREVELAPEPIKKEEVAEEQPKKDEDDDSWSYQYSTPGFKLGPHVEFDRHNLPKKLTLMEFEDETEFDSIGLSLKTKSELSTRRQKATVDFDWNKNTVAQVEVKGNGKTSLKIPTRLAFYDLDFNGRYGITSEGDQTFDVDLEYEQMRIGTIEYERENNFQRVSFSHTKKLPEDTKVMFRLTQTEDNRQSTLLETGGNYDKTSVWVEFTKDF